MTEDFLERLHMADQDDDGDDLKQLKQLRQVWLAMPDEEPPTKGLDALMAAARTKADEMKPAPWWRRMFAVMVKPPALALATIVVVAGGAVLVHNHRDEVEKHERVEVDGKSVDGVSAGNAAAGSAAPVAPPAVEAKPAEAPAQGEALKQEVDATAVADAPPMKPRPVTKKPSAHAGSKGGKGDAFRGADDSLETLKLSPRAEPPPPPPPPPQQRAPVEKPADKAPMPDTGMAGPGAAAPQPTMSNTNNGNAQPMAAQLLAKARAAAERNDCATVKQLLEQIAKLDAAYYRNTAAKDATLGRCMQIAD